MTVIDGKNRMPGYEMTFDKADARKVMRHMELVSNGGAPAPKEAPGAKPPAKKPKDTGAAKGGDGD
jgi:hypothetical protein